MSHREMQSAAVSIFVPPYRGELGSADALDSATIRPSRVASM